MRHDDRYAIALLALACVALAGMLLSTWELVLYPTLVACGVLLAIALRGRGPVAVLLPVGVTALLLASYGVLHAMGLGAPSGAGLLLGWDPMTAVYLFLLGPVFLLVGLLYALLGAPGRHAGADDEEGVR